MNNFTSIFLTCIDVNTYHHLAAAAAAERVFSLLSYSFSEEQTSSQEETILNIYYATIKLHELCTDVFCIVYTGLNFRHSI